MNTTITTCSYICGNKQAINVMIFLGHVDNNKNLVHSSIFCHSFLKGLTENWIQMLKTIFDHHLHFLQVACLCVRVYVCWWWLDVVLSIVVVFNTIFSLTIKPILLEIECCYFASFHSFRESCVCVSCCVYARVFTVT